MPDWCWHELPQGSPQHELQLFWQQLVGQHEPVPQPQPLPPTEAMPGAGGGASGAGALGALALTRFLSGLLFGVSSLDAATFLVMAAILAAVMLLACYIPARRATRIDPTIALRYE